MPQSAAVRTLIWINAANFHLAAAAMRLSVSSRPSAASVASIPGLAVLPVSAARSGCATWPSLRPVRSAKARSAASSASGVNPYRPARWPGRAASAAPPGSAGRRLSARSAGGRARQEGGGVRQLHQCLRPLLQRRHQPADARRRGVVQHQAGPVRQPLHHFARSDARRPPGAYRRRSGRSAWRSPCARRRAPDPVQVEQPDRLRRGPAPPTSPCPQPSRSR